MATVDKAFVKKLDEIKSSIQASEHLAKYLEEEDDEFYLALKEEFEPHIEELHVTVAEKSPLQLVEFEKLLCDDGFEGLFLPRLLGYSVLRGALNDDYKYLRPQEHFKDILLTICNSSNFELLSNRIGQTVEVGFALSSDIWITNLLAEIKNKRVSQFLNDHKLLKFRDVRSRHTSYLKYKNQFRRFNFLTATKPLSGPELKIEYKTLVNFLVYRGSLSADASGIYPFISDLLSDTSLGSSYEHLEIVMLIGLLFDLKDKESENLIGSINSYNHLEESDAYFSTLRKLQDPVYKVKEDDYNRFHAIVSKTNIAKFAEFFEIAKQINEIGYLNVDAIETARSYYNKNLGLSLQNECLRNFIFQKFQVFMKALSVEDYNEYFELNKTFTVYMNIFSNEKFNQNVKGVGMSYIKKLLKTYTVKRSKDYQEIKRFVSTVYVDLGFLNEKEVKELFKTRRKRTKAV